MNDIERRSYPRYEAGVPVTCFLDDEKIFAYMIDISLGGIGLLSERAVAPGTQLDISIYHIEDYIVQGKVKWSARIQEGQQMGIEAENIAGLAALNSRAFPERYEFIKKLSS